jgi:hypothetical protein
MAVLLQALSLTPSWSKEKSVLVRATDALRLCREVGHEELPSRSALGQLDGLRQQDMIRVRDFVCAARLTGFPLSCFEDGKVLKLLRSAITNRDLVVLREGANTASAAGRTTAEQRKLIATIEAKTRTKLNYSGRQYKLVADLDLAKVPERDSYEVVGREVAIRILFDLAKQSGQQTGLADLLDQACTQVSPDWRPPFSQPEGLVLLRRVPSVHAVAPDLAPAITPSQLHPPSPLPKSNAWIKIHLVGSVSGQPIDGVSLTLILPSADGPSSHDTDEDGLVHVTDLPSGTFQLESVEDDDLWELVAHEVT